MIEKNHTYLIYLVGITILATIGIQLYWNYENYLTNKQQLLNEVQLSLDQSLEYYYAETSQDNLITFIDTSSTNYSDKNLDKNSISKFLGDTAMSNYFKKFDIKGEKERFIQKDSIIDMELKKSGISVIRGITEISNKKELKQYPNRISISINQDSIQFPILKNYFDEELKRKNIAIVYSFNHLKNDSVFEKKGGLQSSPKTLKIISKSTFLPNNETIELIFTSPIKEIYQLGFLGILLSLVLSLSIVLCLYYFMGIIKKQKELSLIRNDFVSNITHELKTPIATVATALEGISSFNQENDKEKNKKYIEISKQQLIKLNLLVEKILDTASLDHNCLKLNQEKSDIIQIINNVITRFKTTYPSYTITLKNKIPSFLYEVDVFHFEGAISNVLDNAIKYGDREIQVATKETTTSFEVYIADNGQGIPKSYQTDIFEKFFRVPSGNLHDVKGFGIGLYYALNIILKHNGTLEFLPQEPWTTFKISLVK
jgi:signal transduction histidine kinase